MSRARNKYPVPVLIVRYRKMTPVQYASDGLITLQPTREAKRLKRAGTVGYISVDDWERIRTNPTGHNLDPAYA